MLCEVEIIFWWRIRRGSEDIKEVFGKIIIFIVLLWLFFFILLKGKFLEILGNRIYGVIGFWINN